MIKKSALPNPLDVCVAVRHTLSPAFTVAHEKVLQALEVAEGRPFIVDIDPTEMLTAQDLFVRDREKERTDLDLLLTLLRTSGWNVMKETGEGRRSLLLHIQSQ